MCRGRCIVAGTDEVRETTIVGALNNHGVQGLTEPIYPRFSSIDRS